MIKGIPFSLGIEEEYQIINPNTLDLSPYALEILEEGKRSFPEVNLKPEFMTCQLESNSVICKNIQDVRQEIIRLRRTVVQLAGKYKQKIAAASTHPFASWQNQKIWENERYRIILEQLQGVITQFLIFGYHVHVGFGEDKELLIDVMNQIRYFLPHILALSTSSPFWCGNDTGLKSYRSVIFEALPRTGIPDAFTSYGEYWDYVEMLGKVGAIRDPNTGKPDPTKIWWDIRPNPKFNTLEIRISDIPTKVEEAVSIAALIQALAAKLTLLRKQNMSLRRYRQFYYMENKWRAMRYGIAGNLIDFGNACETPMRTIIDEIVDFVDDVADELGSRAELQYLKTIAEQGTSADRQLAVYYKSIEQGAPPEVALKNVVERLIQETAEGVL